MFRLRAPAKLNLYLRVVGRRPDGYHEIETVFERVNLADELVFESDAHRLELTCDDPALSCGPENLVIKAATLLQQHTATRHGARIHLIKRVPVGAGLGGGSSDAATTLQGLNQLWELHVSQPTLIQLAGQLGADVPFFLYNTVCAIGRDRGDICQPIACREPLFHVLVTPGIALSTKEIYAGLQLDLTAQKPSITIVQHALSNGSLSELACGLWNDLEPEAIRRCPIIAHIQAHLQRFNCRGVRLSGSGSAVFGLCQNAANADTVAAAMRRVAEPGWRIDVLHTDEST